MKLISMTDFVLEIDEIEPKAVNFSSITDIKNYQLNSYSKIINYANFLKKPLELWMFVPCDENGNVLEEPETSDKNGKPYYETKSEYELFNKSYFKAKERVLFEGFEYDNKMEYWHNKHISFDEEFCENKTIEDLIQYNLTLYQTAIKQL
jgi:hypothetical protein